MCRASYRRKNIVDSVPRGPQYLRSVLVIAATAIMRTGVKNSLGRKFRRKLNGNEKEGEEEETLSGREAWPRIQQVG
jgi:hypothetical protein